MLLALALATVLAQEEGELGPPPQNVLVLVADDLGTEILPAYGIQPDQANTPVIDGLAQNGILFRNAWGSPNCTPARATIQTGRYPFRTGVGSLLSGLIDGDFGPYGLQASEVTLPKMLDLGTGGLYAHACFGKWHLASTADGYLGPNLAGYDHFAGAMGNLQPPVEDYFNWERVVDGVPGVETGYATTVVVDDALAWIGQQSEPWFAMINFNAPHLPYHAPPPGLHTKDLSGAGDPLANPRPYYLAMVEAMDTEIGRLLFGLGSQLENTIVMFLSDGGTPEPVVIPPLSPGHAKGSLFEGGLNIPLIVTSSLVPTPGAESDALVDLTDLYSTVAQIAGVDVASVLPPGTKLDSISLFPYFANPALPSIRPAIFSEVFRPNGPTDGLPLPLPDIFPVCQIDLGFGGPGTAVLTMCGEYLVEDQTTDLLLTGAKPSSPGFLVAGYAATPIPLFGGTLVPWPKPNIFPITTDSNGELFVPGIGFSLGPLDYFFQVAVTDFSLPFGFAISNAVQAEFLPRNSKATRNDRYKLIREVNGGDDSFYDLALDPYEANDLLLGGPLTPTQQANYTILGAVINGLIASF